MLTVTHLTHTLWAITTKKGSSQLLKRLVTSKDSASNFREETLNLSHALVGKPTSTPWGQQLPPGVVLHVMLTFTSSSVMYPMLTFHHHSKLTSSTGWAGRRSFGLRRRKNLFWRGRGKEWGEKGWRIESWRRKTDNKEMQKGSANTGIFLFCITYSAHLQLCLGMFTHSREWKMWCNTQPLSSFVQTHWLYPTSVTLTHQRWDRKMSLVPQEEWNAKHKLCEGPMYSVNRINRFLLSYKRPNQHPPAAHLGPVAVHDVDVLVSTDTQQTHAYKQEDITHRSFNHPSLRKHSFTPINQAINRIHLRICIEGSCQAKGYVTNTTPKVCSIYFISWYHRNHVLRT